MTDFSQMKNSTFGLAHCHQGSKLRAILVNIVMFLLAGILLTRTRYGVEKLVKCIQNDPDLNSRVLPASLVGQTAMTDVQQKRTLQNFRRSEFTYCTTELV